MTLIDPAKERTIKELALFIKNKPDEKQSLYCMLLGAGASASSGIRTGQDLVDEWLQVIYQKYIGIKENQNISNEVIREYLKENCNNWYNENNEYASLFGKIYDLANQRRNFIEREVEKSSPSIGYKYLNRLASSNDIDTFFTTNFDDLLEQELSQSNDIKRPIVCAHDSSIFNISIRSQRTKIIKLHGDFLFNDLQSTEQELKALKVNMRNKFEEFLKTYGLIVVGYAGNDDSIMDVLEDLITKDEYLNNGIYWCIRKSDYENNLISNRLIKLLSYKKAYFVLIDDFDTFCAELAHYVINEEENTPIPIGLKLSAKKSEQSEYFIAQKEKFVNCNYIVSDINNYFEINYNVDSTYNIENIDDSNNKKIEKKEISSKAEIIAPEEIDIVTLIKNKQYSEAIELIDKNLDMNHLPSSIYNKYLLYKISCYIDLDKKEDAIKNIDNIIAYNNTHKKDSNILYIVKKANLVANYEQKIHLLEEAYSLDPSDYYILNKIAESKIDYGNIHNDLYNEIIQIYDKSISIEPSSDNDAYLDKLYFVIKNNEKEDAIIDVCNQIINDLGNKDFYSYPVYKAKIEKKYQEFKKLKNNKNEEINNIEAIFNTYMEKNNIFERNIFYITKYISILSKLNEQERLRNIFNNYDERYADSIPYIIRKSNCLINNFYDLDGAINVIENIDNRIIKVAGNQRINYYSQCLNLLLYKKEYEKAIKIIQEQPDANKLMKLSAYTDNLFYYDKNKFLEKIINDFEKSNKNTDDYITYTYNLLKIEEYEEIYSLYQNLINDLSNKNVNKNDPTLKINYNLAKKLRKNASKIRENNLDDIINGPKDSLHKAAAYILIDKIDEAKKILKKEIENKYVEIFRLPFMPVFSNIDFNEFRKDVISL